MPISAQRDHVPRVLYLVPASAVSFAPAWRKMPKKDKPSKKGKEKAAEAVAEPPASATWTCAECGQEHEGEDAESTECVACGYPKPAAAAAADESDDDKFKGFKVGSVLRVEDIADKLKSCTIDVGAGEDKEVTIVTNAPNVAEGARVVVATVGAVVGEEKLKQRSVGGVMSQGMLCDAPMLGWVGGGAGAAALVPESFSPGDRPPERRPRMDGK